MNNLFLFVIMVVVCFLGYSAFSEYQAKEAGKDEPLACIFGYDNGNC
jgi:amino acid transporter